MPRWFLVTLAGFLTHYYFLVFAFFWASLYCLWLLLGSKWKQLILYASSLLGALFIGYLIFPRSAHQLLHSDRGSDAVATLSHISDLPSQLGSMWGVLSGQQFGGLLNALVALAACLFALELILQRVARSTPVEPPSTPQTAASLSASLLAFGAGDPLLPLLTISTAATFVVVSQISPYLVGRYLFFIYPFVALIAAYGCYRLSAFFLRNARIAGAAVLLLFAVATALSYRQGSVDYAFPNYNTILSTAKTYSKYDCIYVTDRVWVVKANTLELSSCPRTYITKTSLDMPKGGVAGRAVVLYVDDDVNSDALMVQVLAALKLHTSGLLYSTDFSTAYLVQ